MSWFAASGYSKLEVKIHNRIKALPHISKKFKNLVLLKNLENQEPSQPSFVRMRWTNCQCWKWSLGDVNIGFAVALLGSDVLHDASMNLKDYVT